MKNLKVVGLVMGVMLMGAASAHAAEFIAPSNKTAANVSTLSGEIHKNLYIAGGSVTVNSDVAGDLAAAGGMVTINGRVENDLFVAGGNLNINGAVGEDARIGGGNVSITAPVAGDLLIGGGNVTIAQAAVVGGDLVVGAGNVSVDSNVSGSVKIGGGNVTINGKIAGDVMITSNESLTFGPNSEVLGKVTYKGPNQAVVKPGAKVGNIQYTKIDQRPAHKGGFIGLIIIGSLFKLLMLLAAGLVLAWLLHHKVAGVVSHAIASPGRSFVIGLLVVIVAPLLGVLLMVTVIGLYLGMMVFAGYAFLLIVSSVLSLFYTGRLVWGWYQKEATVNTWRDLGVGALVTFILGLIPFVGWVIICVLWLITLGALAVRVRRELFHKPTQPQITQ